MPYIHGTSIIKIALAEDHEMFREFLTTFINSIENCKVVLQAANGQELLEKMEAKPDTDIVLLDISMPVMNGYDTASLLREKYPEIKILFCSIFHNDLAICRMIGSGGNGFVFKGASASELKRAVFEVMKRGSSFFGLDSNMFFSNNRMNMRKLSELYSQIKLVELNFLRLICTEKTYKEIASELVLTTRQVDYIREELFTRFDVHSRVGLAFYAYNSGIFTKEPVGIGPLIS